MSKIFNADTNVFVAFLTMLATIIGPVLIVTALALLAQLAF
ncbi:hypothetical protein [Ligilactobacillus equi]|nr:hypothetical protein [Ligilactobacillus equi]